MSNDQETPVIDAWGQPVMSGMREKLPEAIRLAEKSGTSELQQRPLSPDELVAAMDAAGIGRMLLTAWCRPEGWLCTNDEVAEFVRAHPDRFVGVATVHLSDPVAAVRELERAVVELGCRALRIIPWLWRLPPSDRLYYPLYVKCVELGIPFCTQVGHTGPLMPSDTGRPIPYLDEVALTFPDLTIVGGHIGHPWTDEMIGLAWKHDNVFIDTSAYLPRYYPPQLLHYLRTYGRDKVLFATNFPHLPLDRCMAQVAELDLPDAARAAFLHGNAQRVFGL